VRERKSSLARHAKYPYRQSADGAGNAVTIKIERGVIGRADIGAHVHLHAVDNGEKILALKIEIPHRAGKPRKPRRRGAGIERGDVAPPSLQCREASLARPGIVGDIVDGAAERIDFKHRLALLARQDAHAGIKRTARGAFSGALGCLCRFLHSRTPRLVRAGAAPADALRGAVQNSKCGSAGNAGNAEMHFLAEWIAVAQNPREPVREPVDDRDLE